MKSYVLSLSVAVGVILAVAFAIINYGLGKGMWLKRPVALNNAAEFNVKRAAFQQLKGLKVAILGDSLILGRVMAKQFPHSWREYTLDRQLEACLRAKLGNTRTAKGKAVGKGKAAGKTVHVVNFGQNGALPKDFEAMIPQLADADVILLNVNNRSFSADFDAKAARQSRPWLVQLARSRDTHGAMLAAWTRWLLAKRAWSDETTKELTARLIAPVLKYFSIGNKTDTGIDPILLLKLKGRYKTVSFERSDKPAGTSVQAVALANILALPQVWAFGTAENPRLIRKIARKSKRKKMTAGLNALITDAGSQARFIQAPATIKPSEFLDLMHVTPKGYAQYTASICPRIAAVLDGG